MKTAGISLRIVIFLSIAFLLCSFKVSGGKPLNTSTDYENQEWSEPETIFEDPNGYIANVFMFSDSSGMVHLFWSHNKNSYKSDFSNPKDTYIFYSYEKNSELSNSVDILNNHDATLPFSLVWDQSGSLYLATRSGDTPCLNFITMEIKDLSVVKEWGNFHCESEQGLSNPILMMETNGDLYIILIRPDQQSLAIMKSKDKGENWGLPNNIYSAPHDSYISGPTAQIDDKGIIHVSWTEMAAPSGYPPKRIMYFHSKDKGVSWSTPFELAGLDQGQQNMSLYKDIIYVIWNGDAGLSGRYFRWSTDRGENWFERITLPTTHNSGGLQGKPAIIVDNTGTVHVLHANDYYLFYNTFRNGIWGVTENIASIGNSKAHIEINNPYLAITEGNKLHAFYSRDFIAAEYQTRNIQAKHEDPIQFVQSNKNKSSVVTETRQISEPQMTPVDVKKIQNLPTQKATLNPQSSILLISISLVIGMLLIIIMIKRKNHNSF